METLNSDVEKFQQYLENEVLTSIYPSPDVESIKTKSRKPIKPTNQNGQEITLQATPSEGNIENIVNYKDGRKPVQNPSKWPYSVHGVVSAKFEGIKGSVFGTGTLIGPNIVLTAGHNLYNSQKKTAALLESIQFLPGMGGKRAPFGIIEVEKYFVSKRYVEEEKEDYGVMVLKEPIGEVTGYFGLVCPESEGLIEKMVNVTGYPRDKVESKPNTYEMWEMEGAAAFVDKQKGLIHYAIDTTGGQSGSGVWYQEGEEYYVCGVHVAGFQHFNQATLLTRGIYQQIHEWLQDIPKRNLLLHLGETKEIGFDTRTDLFTINAKCVSLLMTCNLDSLITINLPDQMIGTEGAVVLSQNTTWTNLSNLNLSNNNIGPKGAKALAGNIYWTGLSFVSLSFNRIGAEGAEELAQNVSWGNLSRLNLGWNNIGSKGAAALAKNNSWINLSHLGLSDNGIDAEGAKELAKNTSWKSFSYLDLSFNEIGKEGAMALAQNPSWTSITLKDGSL